MSAIGCFVAEIRNHMAIFSVVPPVDSSMIYLHDDIHHLERT